MSGKFVLLVSCAFLLAFAAPTVSAHDEKGHTQDIGEVFGIKTARGREIFWGGSGKDGIGKIIADLIDNGADSLHAKINREIAEICCEKQYYSLFVSGYGRNTANLRKKLSAVEKKMKNASFPREVILVDMREITKKMQDDFYFGRKKLSITACNIEGKLNKLQRALDYRHDFPEEELKAAFRFLEVALREEAAMPQQSFFEMQEKIQDLASQKRLFQWGSYGHRLYFHWGMDERLREFRPLKERADESCENLRKLFPNDKKNTGNIRELQNAVRKKIYSLVEEEWEKRCKKALKDVDSCLKKDSPDKGLLNPDQIRMILEISYYVHILGDYSGAVTSPLAEVKAIREALNKNLTANLWDHKEGDREITRIQNRLVHMDTAEKLLNFLKAEIPNLIEGSDKIRNALW